MVSLDVGCGTRKMGTVNVDINRDCRPHVVCDVCHLPFKAKQFDVIYCYHVLEHIENLTLAIKEILRTSSDFVIIKVPHRFSKNAKKDQSHITFFSIKWFHEMFRGFNIEITLSRTKWLRPNEITVMIRK